MIARNRIITTIVLCLLFVSCAEGTKEKTVKNATEETAAQTEKKKRTIIFFGDSLTAGYGLDEPSLAFPSLIQHRLDSLKSDYQVVNAGVSGETSSGGVGRIDWILNQPVDIFILELGANDGLRGIPVETTTKNLQTIIDHVKEKNPKAKIILAGMQVPPNMGSAYTSAFKSIFPNLSKKNNLPLIPFLLEGVGGEPSLNQADGIHPNVEWHRRVADLVWQSLKTYL